MMLLCHKVTSNICLVSFRDFRFKGPDYGGNGALCAQLEREGGVREKDVQFLETCLHGYVLSSALPHHGHSATSDSAAQVVPLSNTHMELLAPCIHPYTMQPTLYRLLTNLTAYAAPYTVHVKYNVLL